jgi:Na+/H+ antiporter NhaD/arsenite permease-like protein
MMIGSLSGIPYSTFTAALAPVAAIGLLITFAVIAVIFRKEFRDHGRVEMEALRVRVNRVLMWKSLSVSAGMTAGFFWGWPVYKVAIVAGALLLITRRVKPEKVYHEIDWGLLVLFAGLFVVVAGVEKTSLGEELFRIASRFGLHRVAILSAFAGLFSNLVSNVPAVLMFRPVIPHLPDPTLGWLTLAMSSTLAGNLTLLGSVANLIVVQRARLHTKITFSQHLRVGVPLTILTTAAGILWLNLTR